MGKDEIKKNVNYLKYFIGSFLLIFLGSFFVLLFLEKEVRVARIQELKLQEQRVTNLENDFLVRDFNIMLSDLYYLLDVHANMLLDPSMHETIAMNWVDFSVNRRCYDQIRYIDLNGNEKIRINYTSGTAYSVEDKDLQNKKDKSYFNKALQLPKGKVYVSPIDLNMESNQVDIPYKPMIRVSTPIYDNQDILQGVLVLNYYAQNTLENFRVLAQNSQGEVLLINAKGYRISSQDTSKDWAFMFDERKEETFIREYPEEWERIHNNHRQFITEKGLFTALDVDLNTVFTSYRSQQPFSDIVLDDDKWYIVSVFSRTKENVAYFSDQPLQFMTYVLKKNLFYFFLIAIVAGLFGLIIHINRKAYLKIKYHSEYDSLTKAYNRRAGLTKLHQMIPEHERRNFLVSLCFIDINGLKEVNDTLGHALGDELIQTVSMVIQTEIRKYDFLIRLGGDEFLIVFDNIDKDMVESIWERIIQTFETINEKEDRDYRISVSHGVVDFDSKRKTQIDTLIHAADEKMYEEKQRIKANINVIKKQS